MKPGFAWRNLQSCIPCLGISLTLRLMSRRNHHCAILVAAKQHQLEVKIYWFMILINVLVVFLCGNVVCGMSCQYLYLRYETKILVLAILKWSNTKAVWHILTCHVSTDHHTGQPKAHVISLSTEDIKEFNWHAWTINDKKS